MRHLRLLGPTGAPLPPRDESAHRRFRQAALAATERVIWSFPVLDGIEHRNVALRDVCERVEHDPTHPVAIEAARLMRAYVEAFRKDLLRMARSYNRDSTPHIGLTRPPPRWPIEHVAQHLAAVFIQESIIDATEETPLLHPGED